MNFIVKLSLLKKLLTKVFYNLILTIVDWLTKKVQFILYKEVLNVEELVYTFLQNITALQDLFNKIIFNKNKLFTLNF